MVARQRKVDLALGREAGDGLPNQLGMRPGGDTILDLPMLDASRSTLGDGGERSCRPMKIFLSWSGPLSQRVAEILDRYLPLMIKDLRPFLSRHHIESGSRWNLELMRELGQATFGILCLTSENLDSPWLLFEAGALTKHVEGRACGLLIGPLKPADISGPLAQFQHRPVSKDDFSALLEDINSRLDQPLETRQLDLILEKWWPDIQRDYQEALRTVPGESKRVPRDQRDILEEILTRIRVLEKSHVTPRAVKVHHLRIKGDQPNIARFLNELRTIDFGGYPAVTQQYSANLTAVNVESEGPIDLMRLAETARQHQVELEWLET